MGVTGGATSRNDVQGLIPEKVSMVLMKNLISVSAAMAMMVRVPMATNQTRMPVMQTLPDAHFVNGDTGLKQTTRAGWDNKFLNVEEIAAIMPIPENVLDDMDYDFWTGVRPLLEGALARRLDGAVFFGIEKPATWGKAIYPATLAAGHTVEIGTHSAVDGGLAGDFSQAFGMVEEDGYDNNGIVASTRIKTALRNARDANGVRLQEVTSAEIYGNPVMYPMRGMWKPANLDGPVAITGDFTQAILGVRSDFSYKLITEGVITDENNQIVYNLPQQDMVALRVVMRVAYEMADTLNYDNENNDQKCPFASIVNPGP